MSHKTAQLSLDFPGTASMCGAMTGRHPMSPEMADIAIATFLKCIRERLEEASSIAKAAEACAQAGQRAERRISHACAPQWPR